jgi:hypothetical protein
MIDWKYLFMKAAAVLGYTQGYNKTFPMGYKKGIEEGKAEARILVTLLKTYGSFDAIPTAAIHDCMPTMGHHIANQQRVKKAAIKLQAMLEELEMPYINNTVDIVLQYLENDPKISDENCERITAIVDSNSCFGGLISLAEKVDHLDVELFMLKLREPLPNPHLNEYYACLKDEYFVVK